MRHAKNPWGQNLKEEGRGEERKEGRRGEQRTREWVKRELGEEQQKKGNARQCVKVRKGVGEETDSEERRGGCEKGKREEKRRLLKEATTGHTKKGGMRTNERGVEGRPHPAGRQKGRWKKKRVSEGQGEGIYHSFRVEWHEEGKAMSDFKGMQRP